MKTKEIILELIKSRIENGEDIKEICFQKFQKTSNDIDFGQYCSWCGYVSGLENLRDDINLKKEKLK